MTKLDTRAIKDLRNLAVDRCRVAVMSVGQLVDDDVQRAAILTSVAVDLVRGAACNLAEASGKPKAEETAFVVAQLIALLGGETLVAMTKAPQNAKP